MILCPRSAKKAGVAYSICKNETFNTEFLNALLVMTDKKGLNIY
jgi:hypothetical protein